MSESVESGMLEGPIPDYNAQAVDQVAQSAKLRYIELVHTYFSTDDEGPFRDQSRATSGFDVGVKPEWKISSDGQQLGCLITFITDFQQDPEPYEVLAVFRLVYGIDSKAELSRDAIELFVWWDAVFTAWPYWREHMATLASKAGFEHVVVSSLPLRREGR